MPRCRSMIVRPLRRITDSVIAFRSRPRTRASACRRPRGGDEIGLVQTELRACRRACARRSRRRPGSRRSALRSARSTTTCAICWPTRCWCPTGSSRARTPRCATSRRGWWKRMDRAARLCSETLNFARAEVVHPGRPALRSRRSWTRSARRCSVRIRAGIRWRNEVRADVLLHADRDQLFRVLMNLGRNAVQALCRAPAGLISISAWQSARRRRDRARGYRQGHRRAAQAHLFEAFSGSTRPGGTGLGLPIAREIMRAHGGDLVLAQTGADGTVFPPDAAGPLRRCVCCGTVFSAARCPRRCRGCWPDWDG